MPYLTTVPQKHLTLRATGPLHIPCLSLPHFPKVFASTTPSKQPLFQSLPLASLLRLPPLHPLPVRPYSTGTHTVTFHDDIMFLCLLCVPCMSVYAYVCVFILRLEVKIRHLPLLLSHFAFRLGVFSWSWSSWFWINWLATEPWHPPVSTPPALGLQGYAAMLGFFTWVLRYELRSLCSHSKSLTSEPPARPCDLTVLSHCTNSQCLLPLNEQENWRTLGDTFWVQFSHNEPCHCRTMRGFSTFLNFAAKCDTILVTTLWSFECFKRDNAFFYNSIVKNSFKLVILFWVWMLLEFSESFMGVAEIFQSCILCPVSACPLLVSLKFPSPRGKHQPGTVCSRAHCRMLDCEWAVSRRT